jgi:shikimate 5-dehydrogenase
LFKHSASKTCFLTLTDWHLQKATRLDFLKTFAHMGFELRDDLLSEEQIKNLVQKLPQRNILISLRRPGISQAENFVNAIRPFIDGRVRFDLATEVSKENILNAEIISCHESKPNFENVNALIYKWSPLVEDFDHLIEGHNWFLEDPKHRLFFPRSKNGKWLWYRKWIWHRQSFNFINNEVLDNFDQPSLLDSMSVTINDHFAAVLGEPVLHSKSPSFHESFFKKFQMPFFAIEIAKSEFKTAMEFLTKLGLRAAAVTSPLKTAADLYCSEKSAAAVQLGSVNTMTFAEGRWIGANTDQDGFAGMLELARVKSSEKIAVWGGGGVLPIIKSILSNADYFSSSKVLQIDSGYVGVIWAAPPERGIPEIQGGTVKWVIDLNYREDSRAKEFAMKTGARYFSGLEMFEIQAHRQQQIWSQHFEQ